jgi:Uma2 family endonuclease
LSESTESIDRREKLAAYKRLPSLRAFVLIAQSEHAVEVHSRDAQGAWRAARYVRGETIDDAALGADPLALAAVYAGTDLA